jgi:hypothetical protein
MTEQTLVAFMPNGKAGLTTLVSREAPRADLPSFIGSDTIGYSALNVDFSRLMDLIRMFVRMNPMFAAQGQEMLAQIEPVVTQLGGIMGPEVHLVQTATEPMTAESLGSLLAVRCRDPQAFENILAGLGGAMALTPRDFLGQRIYSVPGEVLAQMMPMAPMEDGAEIAIGIGASYVFLGENRAVEQGLRGAAQAGAAALAQEPAFVRAIGAMNADPVVAWGYADMLDIARAGEIKSEQQGREMIAQMRQWDPDLAAKLEQEAAQKGSARIDYSRLARFVGPMLWQVRSNDKGFLARLYQFAGEGE